MTLRAALTVLATAMFVLNANTASADCITQLFGVRIDQGSGNVRVNLAHNSQGVLLCSLSDGYTCQANLSLVMAALLSRREVRFASGGGEGTCEEYIAGTRAIGYIVLQ